MLTNGKKLPNLTKIIFSRTAEIFLGTGLPVLGFFCAFNSDTSYADLLLFYPFLILCAWHIIYINDLTFKNYSFSFQKLFTKPNSFFLLLLILGILFRPLLFFLLLFIVLNWDYYSIHGKRNCISGLFCHFLGGTSHFVIGVILAQGRVIGFISCILYFGFAMISGSMHHDSLHVSEDRTHGFNTGAVCYGRKKWWQFSILPMTIAQFFLLFTDTYFSLIFFIAYLLYLFLYLFYISKEKDWGKFRMLSRLLFAGAGIVYLIIKCYF
ncbi:MAG: hypothetical protein U9O87_08750 [Verrucomicrobiota bacterium]|nr:hypothetical protein [Verrucomicrobiota bacterium]